jgi:hypothetical protein
MKNYTKPNWMVIPFENTRERADIKRHFNACGKREMEELQIVTRLHGLPTIIVLSGGGATQPQVLTFDGIQDIQQAVQEHAEMTAAGSTPNDIAKSLVDSWMELK